MKSKLSTHFLTLIVLLCCVFNVRAQQLKLEIGNVQNNDCNGQCTGSANANASGGKTPYSFRWSNSKTTEKVTQLCAGSYTCVVTDNKGKTASATVTITEAKKLELQFASTPTSCGKTDGSATVTVNGGEAPYKYSWNTNPIQTTATATNVVAGTYTCKVTDKNGCEHSGTVEIKNGTSTLTITVNTTDVKCAGATNGSATASVNPDPGNVKYSWNTNPVINTATANNLKPGSYVVTVTESSGCTATKSIEIKQPQPIKLTVDNKNADCGSDNGKATVIGSGGTEPYTYIWNTNPTQTTPTIDKLKAGNYTCTVTDKNGCTASITATIKITSSLVLTIATKDASCFNTASGAATVNITGGSGNYGYQWNTNPVQTSAIATNLKAGSYEVTVTDPAGCTAKANAIINQPTALAATVKTTVSACNKATGTAALTTTGGTPDYSYRWNTNPAQFTANVKDLNAGNYQCVITDKNGCSTIANAVIGRTSGPTVTINTTVVKCYGDSNGTATAIITQGIKPYKYSWNTTPVQTTAMATGLKAKTYAVVVRDSNSCETKAEVQVKGPDKTLSATLTTTPATCGNADGSLNVNVSGGTPGYTYTWNTSPVQTTAKADKLSPGTYSCTITDKNGCSLTVIETVKSTGSFTVDVSANAVKCYGDSDGTATASVNSGTGTYSYKWSTNPVQTTATAVNLKAGHYTVIVTDNSCAITAIVEVKQTDKLKLKLTSTSATCSAADGTATVAVTGGVTPYQYSWSTSPIQTTPTANNLMGGTYSVIVTDVNSCKATDKVIVTQSATFVLTISAKQATCFSKADGSAQIDVSGGVAPYVYSWNTTPAQTTASIDKLSAGSYTCVVTDSRGCANSGIAKVSQPERLVVTVSPINSTICKDQFLVLKSVSAGGTTPYAFKWLATGETTTDILVKPLATTAYTLNVRDANGCIARDSTIVSVGTSTTTLSGKAYYNTATAVDSGKVYLYDATQSGKLIPTDSTYTDRSGNYNLSGIGAGFYKVMVTSKKQQRFLTSTYTIEGYTWDSAHVITLECGDKFKADIMLDSSLVNQGGTAKISGKLIADKDYIYLPSGSPIKGVMVNLVLQPDNKLIAVATTDVTGSYIFNNIPATTGIKNYYVYVNIPGYSQTETYTLSLANNEVVLGKNYSVGSSTIYLGSAGVTPYVPKPQVSLIAYPNPYCGSTTISYELPQSSAINLAVYNLLGEKVQELENGMQAAGKHTVPFNAEQLGLSKGMYIAKLQLADNTYITRLVEIQ